MDQPGSGQPAPHSPPPRPARRLALTLGLAVLVLVGAAYFLIGPTKPGQSWSVTPTSLSFRVESGKVPARQQITIRPALDLAVQGPAWADITQRKVLDATLIMVGILVDRLPSGTPAGSIVIRTGTEVVQNVSVLVSPVPSAETSTAASVSDNGSKGTIEPKATNNDSKAIINQPKPIANEPKPAANGWIRADSNAVELASAAASATLKITSDGPPREFRIVNNNQWIALDKSTGQTPLTLRISAATSLAGTYTGAVAIVPVDGSLAATNIPVRLIVPPPAVPSNPVTSNPVPPNPVQVRSGSWTGELEGELRIRHPLRPGEVFDLTSMSADVQGSSSFPWLFNTRVQVRPGSGAFTVEVQPDRANSWNLIRVRAGGEPVQLLILDWQIAP